MSNAHTPWLSDWRTFLDETEMSPKTRRTCEAALRETEQTWHQRHAEQYKARADLRFAKRDREVVEACEAMCDKLREIRAGLVTGKIEPGSARSEVRMMTGQHKQITGLHEEIVGQENDLREFAEMSTDDYQREWARRLAPETISQVMPTLEAAVSRMTPPPRTSQPVPGFVPTYDAPSPEDLTIE